MTTTEDTVAPSWWDLVTQDDAAERAMTAPVLVVAPPGYQAARAAWAARRVRVERRLILSTAVFLGLAVLLSLFPAAFWAAMASIVLSVGSYLGLVAWERLSLWRLEGDWGRR